MTSPPIVLLLEELLAMGTGERSNDGERQLDPSAFLLFVCARSTLPPGGLLSLPQPITVRRPIAFSPNRVDASGTAAAEEQIRRRTDELACSLPTAHTCSSVLELPPYTSRAMLRARLGHSLTLMKQFEGLVD
jgi:hypothetical protein